MRHHPKEGHALPSDPSLVGYGQPFIFPHGWLLSRPKKPNRNQMIEAIENALKNRMDIGDNARLNAIPLVHGVLEAFLRLLMVFTKYVGEIFSSMSFFAPL